MPGTMQKFNEALSFLKAIYPHTPDVGIVLGSGLGHFSDEIEVEKEIAYDQVPNFPVSTVEGSAV